MNKQDETNPVTELLARAWIQCDPNRNGINPDELIGQSCSSGIDMETVCEDTPLTGKPNWHWFIPRAEALVKHLSDNGYAVVKTNI